MAGDPLHTTHSASNICHQVASFLIMLVEEIAQFNIFHAFKVGGSGWGGKEGVVVVVLRKHCIPSIVNT